MKTDAPVDEEAQTFVETALKLSGKSAEETEKTGKLDRADEQVEALFAARFQTAGSPIHRAIWDREFPVDLFLAESAHASDRCNKVVEDSLAAAGAHKKSGTLYDANGKVTETVLADLGKAGWWGMLVAPEYGGCGAPTQTFCKALRRMIGVEPTLSGIASVHGGVGAVDPLRTFGTPEQKRKYLPKLASGELLSGFALTEPNAGSDLTALRTKAELVGEHYVINGEKLFITNAIWGRTIAVVVLINGRPQVLLVDLPPQETESFQLVRYGIYALRRTHNNGMRFKNFKVPKENLIVPNRGDGLMIAYHGLNNGRVALCAMASGGMRAMLANMLPWAHFRRTYGCTIDTRELVQRRLGRIAALIIGCDALVDWCSWLLDAGFRGEMECIVAKIFGSEAQKESAIELFMKTHGGRAFLHGHLLGDNIHEYLAPCIYEGEGEMLGMAFFKSLIKEHGKEFFEPIGRTLLDAGIRKPNLANPAHLWKLRAPMTAYAKWMAKQSTSGWTSAKLPSLPPALEKHARFAADQLQRSRLEISGVMRKFQLTLADRQCRMAEVSQRIQDLVVLLNTALWAGKQSDELVQTAADVLCQDLTRKLTGRRPTDEYYKQVTSLGRTIAEGGFKSIAGVEPDQIMMKYAE